MPTTDITRAQAFYRRGLYYYEHQTWDKATNNFRDALSLYPELTEARLHLGVALAKQRRYYEAVQTLETGRHLNLDNASRFKLLRILSTICSIRSDLPAARFYLELAHALEPDSPLILNQLANTLCRSHAFEEGFDLFLKAARQES